MDIALVALEVLLNDRGFKNKEEFNWKQDTLEEIDTILMGIIQRDAKVSHCQTLEDLQEGEELLIEVMQLLEDRGKTRYVLKFAGIADLYVSNCWLEHELENRQLDLNIKFEIKLVPLKAAANKKKEMVVFTGV